MHVCSIYGIYMHAIRCSDNLGRRDEDLIKIHFYTNEPWKILEYCNTIGEIYDIVVEDMIRQSAGLKG
mgnify:CR=1 FL=1